MAAIFSDKSLACVNDKTFKFLFNLYNREAKKYNLPTAIRLTFSRRLELAKYINDSEYTMNDVFTILRELRKAKNFISGAKWLTFDWIIKEDNFIKLMEGKYRDNKFSNNEIKSQINYTNRTY